MNTKMRKDPSEIRPGDIVIEHYFNRLHLVTHMMSGCIAQSIAIESNGLKVRSLLTPRPSDDLIIRGDE